MISIDEINFIAPFKLIHPDLKTIEVITDVNYLNFQTTLGVKEQSLIGCILEDIANENYYKINEIIVVGEKKSWWKFEFFNPMLKVKLSLEKINDEYVLQTLYELSKTPNINILEGRY